MATLVNSKICPTCGSETRPNAMFCYHCGGSLAAEIAAPTIEKPGGDLLFRENVIAGNNGGNTAPIQATADAPILKPALVEQEAKLKSAAAMRRRSKNPAPKRVEVVWEEHDNAPNGWFIFAAVLLTLFAAGILYLALRLR